jgi:hypothetical protein
MACSCHPFLVKDHCLAGNTWSCVVFSSLVKYNGVESIPVPRRELGKLWTKTFRRYQLQPSYPSTLILRDFFIDDDRALHEAKLTILFEKYHPQSTLPTVA